AAGDQVCQVISQDEESVAAGGHESANQRKVERGTAEVDCASNLQLIVAIDRRAGGKSTELDLKERAAAHRKAADGERFGTRAGSEMSATIDCDRASQC